MAGGLQPESLRTGNHVEDDQNPCTPDHEGVGSSMLHAQVKEPWALS
jgi:hypothetical protein